MKFNKGFTLIELLVVIAIIGILSSVVLASLTSARSKGSDAAISSNLANMRAQAELFYGNNGNSYGPIATYTSPCVTATATNIFGAPAASSSLKDLATAANQASNSKTACVVTASGWAFTASTTSSGAWCVDSTGKSSPNSGLSPAGGLCQ